MEFEKIPIIIDGPNFINRVLDLKIDKDIISNQLTLDGLRLCLNNEFMQKDMRIQVDLIEFVCSKKLFGSAANKFCQEERDSLIKRLMYEKGVHIEEVILPGSAEKGVDTTVSSLLETFSDKHESIILFSYDRDFVPVLKKLREKGKKIYLIALNENLPYELRNEAYYTISIDKEWRSFFKYTYLSYDINDDFNIEKFRNMVSNTDDRQNNQLCIEQGGMVYYNSFKHTDSQYIDRIQFKYEILLAYNGYVGPKAASVQKYINDTHKDMLYGWQHGAKGYYDYSIRGGR